MIGAIIGFLIGIGAIALGAKGFTMEGLQVTTKKRLAGPGGMIVGTICILIGLLFLASGLFTIISSAARN